MYIMLNKNKNLESSSSVSVSDINLQFLCFKYLGNNISDETLAVLESRLEKAKQCCLVFGNHPYNSHSASPKISKTVPTFARQQKFVQAVEEAGFCARIVNLDALDHPNARISNISIVISTTSFE